MARGQAAKWVLGVWAVSGDVAGASLRLTVSPTSQKAAFTFGCGSSDGKASCTLGTVDSTSSSRQLEADVTVPATATTVTSVKLTATGDATGITKKPAVSVTIPVTAPSAAASSVSSAVGSSTLPVGTGNVTSQLPVGTLPYLNGTGSTLSPGGNASDLFPTLSPSESSEQPSAPRTAKESARPVADTAAIAGGTSVIGAQIVGLLALALAFVLAVTRLSLRKRPLGAGLVKGSGKNSK